MKHLIALTACLFILSSCGHSQGHDSHEKKDSGHHSAIQDEQDEDVKSGTITNFPAVGFKVIYKDTIPFSVEKTFPLFEPQGRVLLYENWDPTLLREGENGSLKGQVLFSKYDDLDVMLTVTKYNQGKGHIQYFITWGDFEIQRIDVFCTKGESENSTLFTWIEYNTGLYEKGVPLVSMFVKEGYLVKAVERYISNVKEKLKNGK